MNVLEPFKIHLSPCLTARVLAPAASEPDDGSVRPHAPSHLPVARFGTHLCFCASLPARRMWPVHRPLCDATVSATEPSTRASSSMTMATSDVDMPAPPSSSGTFMPMSPSSASLGTSADGNVSSSSHLRACGAISRLAKSRTVSRRIFSDSLSSKSIIVAPLPRCGSARPIRPSTARCTRREGRDYPSPVLGRSFRLLLPRFFFRALEALLGAAGRVDLDGVHLLDDLH